MKLQVKKLKRKIAVLLAAIVLCTGTFSVLTIETPVSVEASLKNCYGGGIYFGGCYRSKIAGHNYYIDVNQYTSITKGEKYLGMLYGFIGKSNYQNHTKVRFTGQYYKVSKNVYRYRINSSNCLTFKVLSEKKIQIIQKGTIIKGLNLTGVYTLYHRFVS